jgi:catalase
MHREDHKVRGKPERFADHYTQARLFYNSQTPVEQQHIINAFRFELSKVQVPAIRERMVAGLMNVDGELAQEVADGLGITEMPEPLPIVMQKNVKAEVTQSKALSLFARPGDGSIRGRKVAIIVADGVKEAELSAIAERLASDGAVPVMIGAKLGRVQPDGGGKPIEIGASLEVAPSVVFDALILPDGDAAIATLSKNGRALEFLKDQYRHCKPIFAIGAAAQLLDAAGVPKALPNDQPDPGLILGAASDVDTFIKALGKHRHYQRESDPPAV